MKRIKLLSPLLQWLISLGLPLLIGACEEGSEVEQHTIIPPLQNDTSYVDTSIMAGIEPKGLLLECFTGVSSSLCPSGHATLESIKAAYPGRTVAVAIHPAPPDFQLLCQPVDFFPDIKSKYDFRTQDGSNLLALIVQPAVQDLPAVLINRKKFNIEKSTAITNMNNCLSHANTAVAGGSPLMIEFKKVEYDSVSRKLTVRIKLTYTQIENDSNYLSVGLLENDLVDAQREKWGVIKDYKHDHILRRLLSNSSGDLIGAHKSIGRVVEREYSTYLHSSWVARNMSVYALVHKDARLLEVLQVKEKKLIQ